MATKTSTLRPEAQVHDLYEQAESRTAQAFEELVSKPSFGLLLARSAENVAALTRICSGIRRPRAAQPPSRRASGCHAARPPATSHRGQARAPAAGSGGVARRACAPPAGRERVVCRQGRHPSEADDGVVVVSAIGTLARLPRATFDFANVILTIPDASIGQTPREVVWTHRGTTLYRYRSSRREHAIPVSARVRADQPAGDLRPAPGQLVRRVPARGGIRRLPRRLGRTRRRGLGDGARGVRLRRAALGGAGDPAAPRARRS